MTLAVLSASRVGTVPVFLPSKVQKQAHEGRKAVLAQAALM